MSAVVWTKSAIESLEKKRLFLSTMNPKLADRSIRKIVSACESLSEFSRRGAIVEESSGLRKLIVPSGKLTFVVHYAILNDEILILNIYDGRQQRPT
jgi:plasmid stabilization system protein ParE